MNDFVKQMARLWGQLALFQRITIGVVVLAVIGGMAGLVIWSSHPPMQLLYGKLNEKDIGEVIAEVQAEGLKYEVGSGSTTGSVYVPADHVHQLRAKLAGKGVPSGDGVGFEIFDRTNFGISDFVQRTNYSRALQGELARTIAEIRGVRAARVMIVMPENRLLFADQKAKPTASVFIDQGLGALSQEAVNSIRFLVANSVEGLNVNDVTVVDSHGNVLTENLKDDPTLGVASSQMKYRKSVEDYMGNKVETMLSRVLGPGSAVVRVSAEVDSGSSTTVTETFDPDKQVVRNEVVTEDTTDTTETDAAGQNSAVGATPNTPAADVQAGKGGKTSNTIRKNKTNSYEIDRTTTNAVKTPGGIVRLSAAVFVAAKAQPRSTAELESLRKMVVNALGIKAETQQDIDKAVSLQEVAFEAPVEKIQSGVSDFLDNYREILRDVVGLITVIIVIFIFQRFLKRVKPGEIRIEVLGPNGAGGGADLLDQDGRVSPEMLNEMIRNKPANVGAALRGWMAAPTSKS
jgi:flagellar M-ring protein FliF